MSITLPSLTRRPPLQPWRRHHIDDLQRRTRHTEARTAHHRVFEPVLVPGLLQTPDYATEILTACINAAGRTGEDVDSAVAQRMARQADWEASSRSTHFLLAEQALYTRVGETRTMELQLRALLDVLTHPPAGTQIAIVPRAARFTCPTTNFVIYDSREVAVETVTGGLRLTRRHDIADYEKVFDLLTGHAVTGTRAVELITDALVFHLAGPAQHE
ncbi:DUF5753 domain-containing protein [Nocardia sp. NPDC088792]|uniref:DUF5753 domain-containing protein n=1 Tax=Nocardia sp. NPDC088792 TaxID=3364332 RepID=UPI0038111B90